MIVSLSPRFEGNTAERFLALARTLYQACQRNRGNDLRMLLDEELLHKIKLFANEMFDPNYKKRETSLMRINRLLLEGEI